MKKTTKTPKLRIALTTVRVLRDDTLANARGGWRMSAGCSSYGDPNEDTCGPTIERA